MLASLPTGPYRIEVAKEGFSRAIQSGVVLQVSADPLIDIALKIGAVSEQVSVEANAAQVETRSSGIGEVVQTQRIVELPLNGRNVTDLVTLAGASVNQGNIRSSFFANLPMIVIAGQPLREPIAQYGPFVMNTREELMQAVEDYRAGRMGPLS